jgi:hypothetical protein
MVRSTGGHSTREGGIGSAMDFADFMRRGHGGPPHVHLMASTYVGTLVCVLCALNEKCKSYLKPLANVIFAVGATETLHFMARPGSSHRSLILGLLSLLGHALVLALAVDGRPNWRGYAVSSAVLLGILAAYASLGVWPYPSPPLVLCAMSIAVLVVMLVTAPPEHRAP